MRRRPRSTTGTSANALRALGVAAGVNAYLRAADAATAAEAARLLGVALEAAGDGRQALDALRLTARAGAGDAIAAEVARAEGLYGFRVLDRQVDFEAASPRACFEFSEDLARGRGRLRRFRAGRRRRLPGGGAGPAALRRGARARLALCGHAARGAAVGGRRDAVAPRSTQELYVRDRSPTVRFLGRAYVLPKSADAAIPVSSVNVDAVALQLYRVGERNVAAVVRNGDFGGVADRVRGGPARRRAGRVGLGGHRRDRLGAEPGRGDGAADGRGRRRARARALRDDRAGARRDRRRLGDGADAVVRRHRPRARDAAGRGRAARLPARAVLGRGAGGRRGGAGRAQQRGARDRRRPTPRAMRASIRGCCAGAAAQRRSSSPSRRSGDFAFLSLAEPGFDLSDRGVEGRPAPPPVDVFVTTERGAYRPGETVYATILARDAAAQAIDGLPLTAIVTRSDGVEYGRCTLPDEGAGGRALTMPLDPGAPTGGWRLAVHADPEAPALASTGFLVEDFVPERLDLTLTLAEGPVDPGGGRDAGGAGGFPLRRAGRGPAARGRGDGVDSRARFRASRVMSSGWRTSRSAPATRSCRRGWRPTRRGRARSSCRCRRWGRSAGRCS